MSRSTRRRRHGGRRPSSARQRATTRPAGRPIGRSDAPEVEAAAVEQLDLLLDLLERTLDEGLDHQPPRIIYVEPVGDGEQFELGVKTLEMGDHPLAFLAGFEAPATWSVLGVIAWGNAHRLPGPDHDETPPGVPGRLRITQLVHRTGISRSRIHFFTAGVAPLTIGDGGEEGRLDDALRLALGLPTAPPARSSLELWALQWLLTLVEELPGSGPVDREWPSVAARHPALVAVIAGAPELRDEALVRFARLGELHAGVHDWAAIRQSCAEGNWPVVDIPPDVAEWMDEGTFSRWMIGSLPDIASVLAAVSELVPPPTARRVRGALERWRLL